MIPSGVSLRSADGLGLSEPTREKALIQTSSRGSSAIAEVWEPAVNVDDDIALAGLSNVCVLVTGPHTSANVDTARRIHKCSARARAPFISVNCAGVDDLTLEAELFGFSHARAAAPISSGPGVLRDSGGTVLLANVHALGFRLQGLLFDWLRVAALRTHTEMQAHPGQVRLMTETSTDLYAAVARREFRADLYYRVNHIRLNLW
jgi:DNA-binding NtrC family response regulator